MVRVKACGLSDVGLTRVHNEDYFEIDPVHKLYIVADGMGGHSHGEVAAQIAVNAIADRYRTMRPSQPLDDFHDLSVAGPALEDLAAHRDELRRIWGLVESLPHQQRTALVLKFQEDMKIEDIAVAMGKSAGAVKLLIHRGVSRLRDEADSLRPVE